MAKIGIVHVRAGFRAILRQPALVPGEIAWRWAFGAAAWMLVVLEIQRILAQVDVTQAELMIARHSDLFRIADAGARILAQVLPQLARECLLLVPAIAILWIVAATVGRAIILQALFSPPALSSTPPPPSTSVILSEDAGCRGAPDWHFGQLAFLNLVRALFTLVTIGAFFAAMFLAGAAMPLQDPAAAVALWITLAVLVAFFWSAVNWFLALAPIWIVSNGSPALKSIAGSVNLYRQTPSSYAAIAIWFGVFRALTLLAAFIAALIAALASPAAAIALSVVIALLYFAVADFLYIARLAAFVALEENSRHAAGSLQPVAPAPQPPTTPEP